MNTLYTWLGFTDIQHMKEDKNAAISSLAIFNETPFDKIVIFANTWEENWDSYERWLKKTLARIGRPAENISINKANITSAIDYPSLIKHSEKWLDYLPRPNSCSLI